MNDDHIDWPLLARYFAAECEPDEAEQVRDWIEADPARRTRVNALRAIWEQASDLPSPRDVETAWRRVAGTLELPGGVDRAGPPPRVLSIAAARPASRMSWQWMTSSIAAAIMLAVGVPVMWWRTHRPAASALAAVQPAMREFMTSRGQRATITLLDGTQVELGVDSRLRVAPFEEGRRDVYLTGEAVFSVVHDPTKPFLVHAANGVTEDLGTEFGVRAYPTDSQVTVVVVSGRVALRSDADSAQRGAVLDAGALGRLDRAGRTRVKHGVDPTVYLAWTKGQLVFRGATLHEVATQLERWFDVEIQMSDSTLAMRRVTATVTVQSLDDVLAAVTFPLGVRYTRTGRVIELAGAPRGR